MQTEIPRAEIYHLLQQIFGTKVELVDYQIGNQHHDYLVLLVKLRHPGTEVVLKLAGPEATMAGSFDRTAMLHRLVAARTDIPMPDILAVDTSCQTWPWRYMIKTHIPGQEWAVVRGQMSKEEPSNAYGQIGNAVAQLHAIQFSAFGELDADGSVIGDESYLSVFSEHARRSIQGSHSRDLFISVLDEHRHLFLGIRHPGLCHEDLHQHNIIFQYHQGQWSLATILDFDKAWAGHPEIDLARLEFWRGMTSDEFWQTYEAICPIEQQYKLRRPIYQLLWCLEYAQTTAEHIGDTQRLCAENGFPFHDQFD